MGKKELPCPHCGQDIYIPARYNAENIAVLEAKLSKMEEILGKHITYDLMKPLVLGQITEDEFDEDTFSFAVWAARKMMRKALAGGEDGS